MISLETQNLGKWFGKRKVFEGINLSLREKSSLVITGRNGSGKTTLLKILCGLIRPSRGEVTIKQDGKILILEKSRNHIGLVMPDLELYGELTAWENLNYLGRIRGLITGKEDLKEMIAGVGLKDREDDLVSSFSSGMKQRLKYAFARLHQPEILLLDEPSANLDEEGISVVEKIVTEQKERGILILATNQREDLKYADEIIQLGR
ncbi:MAG TPA: ABC transporter ATP-binding protein [candidate division Zixibacteria bacterium]